MKVLVVAVAAVAFAIGASGAIGGCSSSSSSSSADGTPVCTAADTAACPTGMGVLQLCVSGTGQQCNAAFFKVGSETFACNSCMDTTACEEQAAAFCYGDAGSGSSSSSGSSSGGSSGSSSGAQDASSD